MLQNPSASGHDLCVDSSYALAFKREQINAENVKAISSSSSEHFYVMFLQIFLGKTGRGQHFKLLENKK